MADRELLGSVNSKARRRAGAALVAILIGALGVAGTSTSSSAVSTVRVAATCVVSGPVTEGGSVIISGPMADQIATSLLPVALETSTDVASAINPGMVVSASTTVTIDLQTVAREVLENKVKPAIIAAGYPQLAPSAWVELDLRSVRIPLVLPAGAGPIGTPASSSSVSTTSAGWSGNTVVLTIDHLWVDTRVPSAPAVATLWWSFVDGGDPAPRALDVRPAAFSFSSEVSIGLLFYGAPVVGTVSAPWSCGIDSPVPVLASVHVVDDPVSTTATTSPSVPTAPSTTPTTGSSTTTTTWPAAPTIPPSACQVSGFDRFGGYEGVVREATGFFRTEKIDGRWWFIDPDGHPFWSQGINHVTYFGTPDKYGATPYHDAAVARYGSAENWADAQVQRMRDWGYNTLGAWSDLDVFSGRPVRKPYTVLLGLTSQDFATGEMEDIFSPSYESRVQARAWSAASEHRDDPYLVGYWSDNELHFGPDWRPLHLFDSYLALDASSPGKQALISFLQGRYPTFAAFAADFTTSATDWAELTQPAAVTAWTATGGEETRAAWVGVVAERYFSVTAAAVRDADPNHLFLGPRFISQTTGRPVLEAAARHVDVASFNLYPLRSELLEPLRRADPTYLPVDGGLAAQFAVLDKPILISEWSFRAADSGLPNTWPPLFPTLENQSQRAAAYEQYVATLLATDWIVGQHWFEHADEPPAGRFDGEDSNFGLVDNADNPYELVTQVSKTMHDCAYARLLGEQLPPPIVGPVSGTPPSAAPVPALPSFTG